MRLSHSILLVLALLVFCAACSTVRLTPSASRYLKNGETSHKAQADLDQTLREQADARSMVPRINELVVKYMLVADVMYLTAGAAPSGSGAQATQPTSQNKKGDVQEAATNDAQEAATNDAQESAAKDLKAARARIEFLAERFSYQHSEDDKDPKVDDEKVKARRESMKLSGLAQHIVDRWWYGAFERADTSKDKSISKQIDEELGAIFHGKQRPTGPGPITAPPPVVATVKTEEFFDALAAQRQLDVRQLQLVEQGSWEYFVDGSIFFSVEPLIAIRPDLEAVAIPSIAINWRPFNIAELEDDAKGMLSQGLSALAFQLTLGGAVNPSGSGENATGGAIGAGFSLPIAGYGAFSFGVVFYGDGSDSHSAPYISLSLGDFGKSTDGSGRK